MVSAILLPGIWLFLHLRISKISIQTSLIVKQANPVIQWGQTIQQPYPEGLFPKNTQPFLAWCTSVPSLLNGWTCQWLRETTNLEGIMERWVGILQIYRGMRWWWDYVWCMQKVQTTNHAVPTTESEWVLRLVILCWLVYIVFVRNNRTRGNDPAVENVTQGHS